VKERFGELVSPNGTVRSGYTLDQVIPCDLVFEGVKSHLLGKTLDYACAYVRDVLLQEMAW
jgi:hypothetical protein